MEVGTGGLHGGLHSPAEVLLRLHHLEGVGGELGSRAGELELAVEHQQRVVAIRHARDDTATDELLVGLSTEELGLRRAGGIQQRAEEIHLPAGLHGQRVAVAGGCALGLTCRDRGGERQRGEEGEAGGLELGLCLLGGEVRRE